MMGIIPDIYHEEKKKKEFLKVTFKIFLYWVMTSVTSDYLIEIIIEIIINI